IPVAEGLDIGTGGASFSAVDGVLAYRTGVFDSELRWIGRDGRQLGVLGSSPSNINPSLSPAGRRVVVARADPNKPGAHLWVVDIGRNRPSHGTGDPGDEETPVWSPDDKYVAFSTNGPQQKNGIYRRLSNGTGENEPILLYSTGGFVSDWTTDGKYIVFSER